MAEGKKTFIFYSDWINMIREMPNSDAGELLKHVLSYVNDENPVTDNLLVKMAFGHMKPMLKKDLDKWEKQLQQFSKMGKKSAEKRALNLVEPKLTYVEPTSTVNVNVNVNDNVNKNDNNILLTEKKVFSVEIYPTFDDFWDEYDKKVGNKNKIKKQWDKLSQKTKELILGYIPNYKLSQPEKRFRKNPETFLNNESWNDELIISKINNNGKQPEQRTNQQIATDAFNSDIAKNFRFQ